ncbi:MAG: hypothetical protein JGK08_13805, partial [Microcoleus sp. PH2017_04_SCI_O_A]|nr:hypothetical protein [Microcoleus sp. PH2017_04_SCI_O_A]
GNNVLKGGNGQDTLIGGSSSDIFVLAPSSGLDHIFYFQGDRDYLGLTQDLTFDQLQIVQGGENYTNDALISIAGTGEHLAWLKDTQAKTVDSSRFVSITPGGALPAAFNTPSPVDILTGETLDSDNVMSAVNTSSSTGLLSTTAAPISQPKSTTTAPITLPTGTTTAPITLSTATTTAPASLQPLTTGTNSATATATSAKTTTNDILLNGGSIPTMKTFSETDDDILVYDTKSLLTSLTSAQTQPILPLTGTIASSSIIPTANTAGKDNSLLITPAASPINLLGNSSLTGTSTVK